MSELRQIVEQPAPAPESAEKGRGRASTLWFGWWVALCLVVLAYSTYGQLAAQRRILAASQQLQAKVGEAALVSAATNLQLGKVAELDAATSDLAAKLQRLGSTNAEVRVQLAGMESTVEGLIGSVQKLDGQAVASHETLLAITGQSEALLRSLRHSQATGSAVSVRLNRMVEIQTAINADLAEMNRNTRDLDRFLGGD